MAHVLLTIALALAAWLVPPICVYVISVHYKLAAVWPAFAFSYTLGALLGHLYMIEIYKRYTKERTQ